MAASSLKKTVVLNVVALTKNYISEEDTPFLWSWSRGNKLVNSVTPPLPAVTCASQTTFLTGLPPAQHGVTANGFYDDEMKQIFNWHQSAGNVKAERLYAKVKREDPNATVFVHTWWYSMYDENIDYLVTVRPEYCANGKKYPNTYTKPATLRDQLHKKYGRYPLHRFWGPLTGIESSQWIANTAMEVDKLHDPTLSLIYLPHLDYSLQKYGPEKEKQHVKKDLKEIDTVLSVLVSYYEERGAEVVILSEYGIVPVNRPVHINRLLRERGYVSVVKERGGETLDCGASAAFAHADHQVAHVYVKRQEDMSAVKTLLENTPGVDKVLTKDVMKDTFYRGRCGDLLCIASPNSWFTYYFWLHDKDAPDYAHCVAIHEKPGYDPTEMFLRFDKPFVFVGIAHLILKAVLSQVVGIRTLVDATPIDRADDVRGSHGRVPTDPTYSPIIASTTICDKVGPASANPIPATDVCKLLLDVLRRPSGNKSDLGSSA
eukprot:CAMPEP_0198733362 /NCGR_PEP_ID=MMETSP1475-20131203/45088_1 /TAXON_ID= ORGANISM="Unidentified sp., Strain CCMP1999" /NCGR_SAMPLE_ID=MMETSP1475 /ASSEMBLY_ACC=CAM_ASM_001111 /LENGTH=487 /DNA_ID=CAMNT_0044496647 /DNA_START=118 /DNA_END=1577 /DNA_ORIENTATION=-